MYTTKSYVSKQRFNCTSVSVLISASRIKTFKELHNYKSWNMNLKLGKNARDKNAREDGSTKRQLQLVSETPKCMIVYIDN